MKKYKARLGDDGRLTDEQVIALIGERQTETATLDTYKAYFEGKNTKITEKDEGTTLQVPYARTLILISVGFMYKPGLIGYSLKTEMKEKDLIDSLKLSFDENDEELLNTELGQDQATYGEAYELHFINEEGEEEFARVSPQEFIPVYSYTIKPKLIAGIRYYTVKDGDEELTEVDIYYPDLIQKKKLVDENLEERESDQPHPYQSVPVAIFKNNTDSLGDIEPIKGLIDAYDTLLSAYIDDEEKFAEAVLLLFGRSLDDEAIDRLARLRIIDGLDKESDDIKYLTKDETQSARQDLIEIVRKELHRQSFIPDMTDPSVLGQKSGEAFQYLFALFELSAAVKEAYFAQGIHDRIRLTTMGLYNPRGEAQNIDAIQVTFTRNLPKDNVMWASIFRDLWGTLPASALVKILPFLDDPEGVLKEMEKEKTGDGMTAGQVNDLYKKQQEEKEPTREAV